MRMKQILLGMCMITASQLQAETQYDCTMYKICQPRVDCENVELSIPATASNSELRIGNADDALVLKAATGQLGTGITYADIEAPNTYNVVTLRPDGEMYMSSHKNTKYGGLGSMYLRCEVN